MSFTSTDMVASLADVMSQKTQELQQFKFSSFSRAEKFGKHNCAQSMPPTGTWSAYATLERTVLFSPISDTHAWLAW